MPGSGRSYDAGKSWTRGSTRPHAAANLDSRLAYDIVEAIYEIQRQKAKASRVRAEERLRRKKAEITLGIAPWDK